MTFMHSQEERAIFKCKLLLQVFIPFFVMVLTNVVQVFEDEDHSEMILDTCNVGAILILMDSTKGVHAY